MEKNLRIVIAVLLSFAAIISAKADNHDEFLPDAKLKAGIAKLTVEIKNYNPRHNTSVLLGDLVPLASAEYLDLNIPLNENGKATIEIPLHIPQLCRAEIGGAYLTLLLAPDEEIGITLESTENGVKIDSFSGFMAQTHKDFSTLDLERFTENNSSKFLNDLINCNTPQQRLACIKSNLERQKQYVDSLQVTSAVKAILRMSAESEYLSWMYNFGLNYIGRQAYEKIIPMPSPEDYGRVVEEANALIPATPSGTIGTDDYFEILGAKYASCMYEFWIHGDPMTVYIDSSGIPNEYNRDLTAVHALIKGARVNASQLLDSIKDKDCRILAEEFLAAKQQKVEQLSQSGNYKDVAPADILQIILDKYKGKTVVIDIWATWCGPCLLAHKQMEPLKDELNDEDIVFVYLTSDVSPLEKWESMLSEIKGEHFYLTNDQLSSILEHYNSTGFPTYAVYDRNATLLHSSIGFPGVDKIKSLIAK